MGQISLYVAVLQTLALCLQRCGTGTPNDDDWDESFLVERVEFPYIHAVNFVIYGIFWSGC